MTRATYALLENYMLTCMDDSAHDREHVYRVLYHGLEIARTQETVDYDVLIAACLLHDIGRGEQFENPALCHAAVGGEKAFAFLTEHGFDREYAERVRHCVQTHRYREDNQPQSLEAKILFDADKLDAAGAMGIARTLIYKGIVSEPLYSLMPDGTVSDGENDAEPSFFQEYKYKLEHIYDRFYTEKAACLAGERRQAAVNFYHCLFQESASAYRQGRDALAEFLTDS